MSFSKGAKTIALIRQVQHQVFRTLQEEKGEMVGTIGWMAIMATVLVLIHGLITGWLPGFVTRVFTRMDGLL